MLIRNAKYASLTLAALLLVGCESQPPAGPLPVRVAQTAAPAPAAPATGSASPALAPASGGFSLPIGADIPPATPDSAPNPAGTAQQPPQAPPPKPIPPAAPATPAASSPAPAQGQFIHLSAGIAVPQSLPIGTVMAISVDYSLSGELKTSSRYALVVKSATAEIVNEVQLEPSGNLSAFFQQLKPEHRPFSVRIEEVTPGSKRRTIISNEVTLKTDY